jgi:hypothetical protein
MNPDIGSTIRHEKSNLREDYWVSNIQVWMVKYYIDYEWEE